jgi:putative ABC transport system permease protein
MEREARHRYDSATSVASYSLIVGPKEGSGLELVLNTVFNYGISQGVVPYSTYMDLRQGKLRNRGFVKYAIPQSRGDNWRGFPIIGTTDEMFSKFQTGEVKYQEDGKTKKRPIHLTFAAGAPFEFGHDALDEFMGVYAQKKAADEKMGAIPLAWRKAVVGALVAARHGVEVGDKIVPMHGSDPDSTHPHPEAECEVVGVLARTGTPLDRSVYIPLSAVLAMDGHESIRTGQEIKKENIALSAILVKSATPLGAQHLRYAFQTRDDAQGAVPFFEIVRLLNIIGRSSDALELLSYIVLLVTGSTVLLGLYNTMNERRREIAIMRSLGARRGQILQIILQEALFISLVAGVLGVALCHAGVFFAADGIEQETGISVDWTVFDVKELILILGVGVLGSVAGILPAVEGSRVPVAENLGPTS